MILFFFLFLTYLFKIISFILFLPFLILKQSPFSSYLPSLLLKQSPYSIHILFFSKTISLSFLFFHFFFLCHSHFFQKNTLFLLFLPLFFQLIQLFLQFFLSLFIFIYLYSFLNLTQSLKLTLISQ